MESPLTRSADVQRARSPRAATHRLVAAVQQLSLARNLNQVMAVVSTAARELTGADGATFVLKDNDKCHYVDENAIAPLWKGQRFPMSACISGWTMLNRQSVVIEDIYDDPRVPADAYRPTFVKSLAMVPIRPSAPIGAIGNYWAVQHRATAEEVELLEALANTTAVALENIRAFGELQEQAALLDLAQDAILVGTLDGTLHYWNKGAERIHGWTAQEVLGRRTAEFLYPDASWLPAALAHLQEHGEWKGELVKKTKSGSDVIVESRWTLVRDVAGRPSSVLSISTDITEKKQMQEQFLRAQRMESIGALAGGIAHDLNNLLAPILICTGLLSEKLRDKEHQEILGTMKTCSQRAAELARRILSFAKRSRGETKLIQVRSIIHEIAALARATFGRNIQVSTELPQSLPLLLCNPIQIHQVLINLAVNARDAMPRGGALRFLARQVTLTDYKPQREDNLVSGSFLVMEVADEGEGIPPELQSKMFQPFFTTKGENKGTGLGLSTALGIVTNHAGFIEVTSQPGRGTTFSIFLPLHA